MNDRERFISVLKFQTVDRIPFQPGHARESTLVAWRAQGLPPDVDWRFHLCELLKIDASPVSDLIPHGANFRMIPQFEEKVIERKPRTLIVQDWKGNVCEISDRFDVSYLRNPIDFVTRRWIKCPVETRDDWEAMKQRYDATDASRLPGPDDRTPRERAVLMEIPGVFWQLREWLGFEELCRRFLTDPDLVGDMCAFWSDFVAEVLQRALARSVPDYVMVSEDMAYKEKIMISPGLAREYLLPAWKRWGKMIKKAGCPLYGIDSDGYVEPLIPLWQEAGFDSCWPLEVAAGNDLPRLRRLFGKGMAYHGGVDKREMARGGDAIRTEFARLEPVARDGGYIPGCDHGIPADVPWPAMVEYGEALARVTGWK